MRKKGDIRSDWNMLYRTNRGKWQDALAMYKSRDGDASKEPWLVVEGVLVDIGWYDPLKVVTGADMAAEEYEQAMAAREIMDGSG